MSLSSNANMAQRRQGRKHNFDQIIQEAKDQENQRSLWGMEQNCYRNIQGKG